MTPGLALCIYSKISDEVRTALLSKCKLFDVTVFEDYNEDKFRALYNVSILKRHHEIATKVDFTTCLAIGANRLDLIDSLSIRLIPKYRICHFIAGEYKPKLMSVSIDTDIFYADSSTFDRICEYHLNLPNINPERIFSGVEPGDKFYYHLKSLMLKSECTNFENRDLLIRPAQIN
jgi:hypothetical protein